MNRIQQITRAIMISWILFFISSVGYMVIEKWNFLDAAYMTALTITTVGFMEVHETSDAGKIFTIFVMIAGVGYFLYITGIIIQAIVEGEIQTLLGRSFHGTAALKTECKQFSEYSTLQKKRGNTD